MFVGMRDYTVRSEYYPREMGESCPPRKPQRPTQHVPREMGETPADVARTAPNRDTYQTAPSRPTYETRPREMSETPEDVARSEAKRPKTWEEMTEQERVLDMYA